MKTCYDAAGQAVEVKNAVSGAAWASQGQYEVNGGLKQLTLGNGALETREYNTRWQARTVKVTQGQTSLLELQYRYCADEAEACAVNNGNVASQRVVHAGLNALTSYEYDSLNRLKKATDLGNQYQQVFDYDRYGNRALTAGWNPYGNMAAGALSAYDGGKNQVIALAETVNGTSYTAFQYDARGNLLTQVGGRAYTYDAENRMVEAKAAGVTQGIYKYDGDGRRVEAVAGGKTTRYVYDAFGSLAAEYEVGSGGGGVETTYLTQDALGSTRLAMRGDGSLRRYEYAPFGEAIESDAFGRGAEYGDGAGRKVTQRFTGKERDGETGLDYFGARYLSSAGGRFTSVDPDSYDSRLDEPQSWNLYSYTWNSPLRYVDDDGRAVNFLLGGIGAGVGFVTGFGGSALSQYLSGGEVNWGKATAYGFGGAASGSLAGLTLGGSLVAQALGGAAIGTAGSIAGGALSRGFAGEEVLNSNAVQADFVNGAIGGVLGGGVQFLGTVVKLPAIPKVPSPLSSARTQIKRLARLEAWLRQRKQLNDRFSTAGGSLGALYGNVGVQVQDSLEVRRNLIAFGYSDPTAVSQKTKQEVVTSSFCVSNENGEKICQ